jgi:hypothetical protein
MFSKPVLVLSTAILLAAAPAVAQDNEYEGHVRYPVPQSVSAPTAAFAHVVWQPASRHTAAERSWFDRVTRPGY